MTTTIETSIIQHAIDRLADRSLEDIYSDDLHHYLFNEDYFITYYSRAEQWLKDNDLSIWEVMSYCKEQEQDVFGEIQTSFDNPETLVNHYAYWKGQELLSSLEVELSDRLTENDIKNLIYNNIYNNLNFLYKTKGTRKSFSNLLHCFGVDEELLKINPKVKIIT